MDVTDLLDLDSFPDTTPYIDRHSIHRGKLRDGIRVAAKTSGLYYFGEERRKRLPKLLDIWAKCSHQNIVQLIGQATFRNDLALVYAWHKYGSITEYLNINPSADHYQLSAQICDGVAYLHANDIVSIPWFLSHAQ
ncbi:unnamed protein product [Rhizoctonia solani]|nr:unnamed protein product [Rhizoctonia solani]